MQQGMSQDRLLALEKETRAFQMRRDGQNLKQIADALGYANESGAYKAIQRAYKRTAKLSGEDAEYQRALDLARCDVSIIGLMPGVESGKPRSIEALMSVLKRRADLLGLDKPQKVAPTTPDGNDPYDGLSDAALVGELNRLLDRARTRASTALGTGSPLSVEHKG